MSRDDGGSAGMPERQNAYRAASLASTAVWGRIGRAAGYFAGGAFFGQTVLYLLDATGALTPRITYRVTDRGSQQDLVDYYLDYNERMHSIWWDVALRDVLGPLRYLALMVLVVALLHVAGSGKPLEELGRLFVVLGGSAAAVSDVMYLSHVTWWRHGGFQPTPDIIAYGRAFEIVDTVGSYLQWAGYLVLAVAFACLAPTLRGASLRRRWLSILAYGQAAALLAFVLTNLAEAELAGNIAALASGAILAPALAILLGHALVRTRAPY
jgi:hypothetical protein